MRSRGLSPHQIIRLGIGHVPEGRHLFPKMTVLENLKMGAYLQRSKATVAATLERIYEHFPILKERGQQRAGSLSGGEQQMLATARALMNRPRLLMLDEPSIGLSPIMTAEIGKIVQQINAMGGFSHSRGTECHARPDYCPAELCPGDRPYRHAGGGAGSAPGRRGEEGVPGALIRQALSHQCLQMFI